MPASTLIRCLKSSSICLTAFLMSAMLLIGCSGRKTAASMESDANGYQCDQCNLKFYTDHDVFAGVCPACKPGTPFSVVGYVCPKDNHMTILRQGRAGICEQCKGPVTGFLLPRESDLKAWGAVKKTKAEVSPK
jgi:hypothetical protein